MNMLSNLNILITNDDGLGARGLLELVSVMRPYGHLTIVAPKRPQSGMSVAVSLGATLMSYKKVLEEEGASWSYLDATPASCVKYALDKIFPDRRCDVVISGINHGTNTATATNYSGTLGAAEEAAINGIPAIGVSLCEFGDDPDFSKVKEYFPAIFERIMSNLPERKGISYNINFPPSGVQIKGVRVCHQGKGFWIEELEPWNGAMPLEGVEEGEKMFVMRGRFIDDTPEDDRLADHHAVQDGYVSIAPQTFIRTDFEEVDRLNGFMNSDF
ncbi:MAG: 5'/3'-nucleotidase SurE [Bacteroidales bacterium]|nr:5'/3'-nucleotidase SurE [Bacteroidales bacterium]